ncbi:MAG: isocitrate lyase/PEP mutase family protein [Rhodospirillaceae bacterium]|nr:isocitrate lyase/PEP mutase family protein [Rhodospirillaceae bacterium]MBT4425524.1 isocitrate lyase/PEP mutase family protein [Rhodospirillaceae bacterium]MBT6831062.1 isocitrate lyase/PEP mutase family protein [Rhodospirillaceae bacterium]
MNAKEKRARLAETIRKGEFVTAPGIYDMISAKVADQMPFNALYMTGYGVAASHLGVPDAGIASFGDVVSRVRMIANGTNAPLICDADTGFGGLLNVHHTVKGYEDAGCSAIQMEDQESPKKCGHTPDRRVVPIEDMVEKIQVAVEARSDPNFLIIARTDSRTGLGLDEAIKRGHAFADAGADVIFVESPESVEELEIVGRSFEKPTLANMADGGKTPILPADQLQDMGFSVAIFPGLGMLVAAAALESAYRSLLKDGTSANLDTPMIGLTDMHKLMGFEEVWAFERKWARGEAAE